MKKVSFFMTGLLGLLLTGNTYGQVSPSHCSAAFIGNKMLVDKYTDKGKCEVSAEAAGVLSVKTVELAEGKGKPVDAVPFKVAIRDKNTGTLTMFAGNPFLELDVKKVLYKCRPGDSIVLLTTDPKYALPHKEIVVKK